MDPGTEAATASPGDELLRPAASAQIMFRFAREHGLTETDCLRGTDLQPDLLFDPDTEISTTQELAIIRNLVHGLRDQPFCGLDVGLRYRLSTYGIWGYALLSSSTFRSAARLAVRYLDLSYALARYRLESSGGNLRIVLDDSTIPEDLRQFLVERDFAAWAAAAWELRPGGFHTLEAQFRFPQPSYARRLEKLCGVKPVYGARRNAILLAARDLDAPLPQADPQMARMCEEQCRQLLARRRMRSGYAGRVRNRLLRSPATMPSIEELAEEMHMGSRTLRRHLRSEGVSYRGLVDEVRQTLAEELLSSTQMKLAEVAERLGYTEPSAFVAAFRRWKRMSPGEFRKNPDARPH